MVNENVNPNHQAVPEPAPVRTYTKAYPPLDRLASNHVEGHNAEGIRGGEAILDEHIVAASMQHSCRKAYHQCNCATLEEVVASKKRKAAILFESIGTVPVGNELAQNLMQVMNQNHQALVQEIQGLNQNHQALVQVVNNNHQAMNQNHQALVQVVNNNHQALTREVRTLRQRFTGLNERMQHRFTRTNQNITHTGERLGARIYDLHILALQNKNRTLSVNEEITQLPNIEGEYPPRHLFPHHPSDIVNMAEENLNELLAFYDILPPQEQRVDLNGKKSRLVAHLGLKRLEDAF